MGIFCAATFTAVIVLRFSHWKYFAFFALMGGTLAAVLFYAARKKLIAAEVIVENTIIHIQLAALQEQKYETKEETKKFFENYGVCVSNFGIMLGNKIIKWGGSSGVWLKAVEIGPDYISFIYGEKGREPHNIRLLYFRPGEDELAGIIEKFRKDTGVVPVLA